MEGSLELQPKTGCQNATTNTNGGGDYSVSGLCCWWIPPLNCLKIRGEHQKAVERLTVGRRENPACQNLKKGRLTASNFEVILKAKRLTPSLMKHVTGEYDLSWVQAISWGITNEAEAVTAFETVTEMAVKETGLWLDLSEILGASPDGLVGDNALLEAKCPFKERKFEEASQQACFCLEKDVGGFWLRLKNNHIYWDQVQGQLHLIGGQLHLSGRQLCYFVVWTTKDMVFVIIPLRWVMGWKFEPIERLLC